MKFCKNCGKEIAEDAIFCDGCGTKIEEIIEEAQTVESEETTQEVAEQTQSEELEQVQVKAKKSLKDIFTKKVIAIIASAAVLVGVLAGVVVNTTKMNKYKDLLEKTYTEMCESGDRAEKYCSLQSKVWYNCICENDSIETDKYTKYKKGSWEYFYDDFNDALQKFYEGESLTHSLVSLESGIIDSYMAKLKDCPKKFEDEYNALKALYVAYSPLAELVIGDSSYSYNTFSDALEIAKTDFKSAKSQAQMYLG